MKKIIVVLSFLLLVGCSGEPSTGSEISTLTGLYSAGEMQIVPTAFSNETTAVLSLIDSEMEFFDFSVNESVQSVDYSLWVFNGEVWEDFGGSYGDMSDTAEMIALNMQDDSFELFSIDENGHTSVYYPSVEVDFSDMSMTVQGWLDNPTEIMPGEEILLYHKYGTNENSISTNDTDFRSVDCEVGVAVTVTFSGDIIE